MLQCSTVFHQAARSCQTENEKNKKTLSARCTGLTAMEEGTKDWPNGRWCAALETGDGAQLTGWRHVSAFRRLNHVRRSVVRLFSAGVAPARAKAREMSTCKLTLAVAGCSDSLAAHIYVPQVSGLSRSGLVLVRCLVRFVCDTEEHRKVSRAALIGLVRELQSSDFSLVSTS